VKTATDPSPVAGPASGRDGFDVLDVCHRRTCPQARAHPQAPERSAMADVPARRLAGDDARSTPHRPTSNG